MRNYSPGYLMRNTSRVRMMDKTSNSVFFIHSNRLFVRYEFVELLNLSATCGITNECKTEFKDDIPNRIENLVIEHNKMPSYVFASTVNQKN